MLKNATVGQIYGMQQDLQNRQDAQDAAEQKAKIDQVKLSLEVMKAKALANKDYTLAQKYQTEIDTLLPAQVQHQLASAGAANASMQNSLDKIGTHGRVFQDVTNPENGLIERTLVDTKTGKPVATYGPPPPKGTGNKASNMNAASTLVNNFMKTYVTKMDREGRLSIGRTIPDIAVDGLNSSLQKLGEDTYTKYHLNEYKAPGLSRNEDPIDILVPKSVIDAKKDRDYVKAQLINVYGVDPEKADAWVKSH